MNEAAIHYLATVNKAQDRLEWANQYGTPDQREKAAAELENARNAPGKPSDDEETE